MFDCQRATMVYDGLWWFMCIITTFFPRANHSSPQPRKISTTLPVSTESPRGDQESPPDDCRLGPPGAVLSWYRDLGHRCPRSQSQIGGKISTWLSVYSGLIVVNSWYHYYSTHYGWSWLTKTVFFPLRGMAVDNWQWRKKTWQKLVCIHQPDGWQDNPSRKERNPTILGKQTKQSQEKETLHILLQFEYSVVFLRIPVVP